MFYKFLSRNFSGNVISVMFLTGVVTTTVIITKIVIETNKKKNENYNETTTIKLNEKGEEIQRTTKIIKFYKF